MSDPLVTFKLAMRRRRKLVESFGERDKTDAYRLVHGSADGFPGVTLDRYGSVLVLEGHSPEVPLYRFADLARSFFGDDAPLVVKERWSRRDEDLGGRLFGDVPEELEVQENGLVFGVRPASSEHCGLFLDSRPARKLVRGMSEGLRVLNLFAYTGGFGVAAAAGGAAATTNVDNKTSAVRHTVENYRRNGLSSDSRTAIRCDAFDYLRREARRGGRYDLVILDPPPISRRKNKNVYRAESGYARLAARAMSLLSDGGRLLAGLNAGRIGDRVFLEMLEEAGRLAHKTISLETLVGPGADFPPGEPDRPTARFALLGVFAA